MTKSAGGESRPLPTSAVARARASTRRLRRSPSSRRRPPWRASSATPPWLRRTADSGVTSSCRDQAASTPTRYSARRLARHWRHAWPRRQRRASVCAQPTWRRPPRCPPRPRCRARRARARPCGWRARRIERYTSKRTRRTPPSSCERLSSARARGSERSERKCGWCVRDSDDCSTARTRASARFLPRRPPAVLAHLRLCNATKRCLPYRGRGRDREREST